MDLSNKIVLNRLRDLRSAWKQKQVGILVKYNAGVLPHQLDLQIWLPGCNSVTDYSLISNEGILAYKLPDLLVQLWRGNVNDCVKLQQDLIDYQVNKSKNGGVNEIELKHCGAIGNVISWILKHKFRMNPSERKDITSGNQKRKTHFQGGTKIE